ncbi:AI-2E family transporter [Acidocella facilis]|uniref:AI-2E family transporter n=1 Tax=Acidocella facilis TaxID=525 RepID=UPI00047D82BF|nr:AI-2E family transporter [Acidocella facilis]
MRHDRLILLALAIALGLGCALILLPFLPAMLWAGILVFCLWPIYTKGCVYVRPVLAAGLITLVVAVLLLVPLVHLAMVAAKEARVSQGWVADALQNGLPPAPPFMQKIPVIGGFLADFWNNSADDLGGVVSSARPVIGTVAHTGIQLLFHVTHGLVETVVALLFTFLFFVSGAQMIERIRLVLVRVIEPVMLTELITLVAATVRGVVFGILGTAAFQGILYAIGFEVARAPQALVLAVFAGLISIVPAGAVLVYVPLCLYMIAAGHPVAGILLAIYCFVVVGGADSVLRPWLIARGAALPYAVTLIGVLGGALAFGALGIFLGPVLLALGIAMAEQFARQPRGTWRQP